MEQHRTLIITRTHGKTLGEGAMAAAEYTVVSSSPGIHKGLQYGTGQQVALFQSEIMHITCYRFM